jgi:hypothetical protein
MKLQRIYITVFTFILVIVTICAQTLEAYTQCSQNFVYGLTNAGMIRRINVASGLVSAPINPAHTGNLPSYSNAIGYNPLNGKYYFFKRNSFVAPQEFMSFDPATNLYSMLAPSPVGTGNIINLGCVTNNGLGYYCLDALGTLYYYNIVANTWTTICTNIRNQFNTTLLSIIDPMGLRRYYGDISIDGLGNLWLLVSGAVDYGLYKISAPLPTSAVANLTATQTIPPTTPSPGGSFGGMAFNEAGDAFISSNSPDNKLYKLTTGNILSFVTNLGVDGIGNDLASCSFPLVVLSSEKLTLTTNVVNENTVIVRWNVLQPVTNASYTFEHSIDGVSWQDIHSSMNMTNDPVTTYTYSHKYLSNGIHFYRIRKTDASGTIEYSIVKKVMINSELVLSIWPNPTQDILKVQEPGVVSGISQVFIHDLEGRMISQSTLKTGVNSLHVNTLQPGTYIVRVRHSNGETINRKFVKQ